MPRPNVLVIAIDGLRASVLGAYGNTSYHTPSFDHFAAQSILCDSYFTDSVELPLLYRGLWRATSALRPHALNGLENSFPTLLAEAGYITRLITDCRKTIELQEVRQFSEAILIEDAALSGTVDIEQTCAGRVLAETFDSFARNESDAQKPFFLWSHLQFAYGPWDAPHELAMALVEEGDEAPEASVVPPDRHVDRSTEADEIYSETCRYAAQVMMLDSLLAPLFDFLDSGAAGDCVCVLTGTRGFPLGEHHQLGGIDGRLYSEQLHVPLLLRLPEGRDGLSRVASLLHPADLPATLLGLLGIDQTTTDGMNFLRTIDNPNSLLRTHLLAGGMNRALSIRTPSWYLRIANQSTNESVELFVKPDDKWELNDVASLCSEVAIELSEFAVAERTRIETGKPFAESLPNHLVDSMV